MSVSIKQLHDEFTALLEQAGSETARLDARILISHAYDLSHEEFLMEGHKTVDTSLVKPLILRRLAGEPVAKILGQKEFWSHDFIVSPSVLDPRPDSETLIEAILKNNPDKGEALTVLDLGTGSGCLLISVLSEYPNAKGYGVDISAEALGIAQRNAIKNQVADRTHFICGSWDTALYYGLGFDIVISNPPYIPTADIPHLAKDVRDYDPLLALDGGADGLESYREIIALLPQLIHKKSEIYFECGQGQHQDIEKILHMKNFQKIEFFKDLSGIERIIYASVSGQ